MKSDAMKKEIKEVGHGYTANCWCTHGCWIMASLNFNPGKMVANLFKSHAEAKKLQKLYPVNISDAILRDIETRYNLDTDRLKKIGVIAA
jgi:hypothetical protein